MKSYATGASRIGLLLTAHTILILTALPAHAVDRVKANNTTSMVTGSSWVGNVAPTTIDTAVFNDVFLQTATFGTGNPPPSWLGLRVEGTTATTLINVNNTTYANYLQTAAGGIDMSAAPRDLKIVGFNVGDNQTWSLASGRTLTLGGTRFSGTGDVDITGSGTVIINTNGTDPYSGTLSVSGGTLQLNDLDGGDVKVNDGGILDTELYLPADLTLGSAAGGGLVIDPSTAGAVDADALTLIGTNTVYLSSPPVLGSVDVVKYVTISGDETNFALDPAVATTFRNAPVFAKDTGVVTLTFVAGPSITWTGSVDSEWDQQTTANWDSSGATSFYALDSVVFDDSAANKTVNISADVSPFLTSFTNTAGNDYTIGGTAGIAAGSLSKSGTGTVTLSGTNTYTGTTTLSDGLLVADYTSGSPLSGSSSIAVISPGILNAVHDDGDFTLSNVNLSGDGTVALNPLNSVAGTDRRSVMLTGDNSAFTGSLVLKTPAAPFTWRVSQPTQAAVGDATITVESGAQFFAANTSYTNAISLRGDGFADTEGFLGALQLTGSTSSASGTNWNGSVTITGTPGDSGGVTADGTIGFSASSATSYYGYINGSISGGDLGVYGYSFAGGRERLFLTNANNYGDTIVFANDIPAFDELTQTQLVVGGASNTTATLGTGKVYLSGGANGKIATLVIQRADGYMLPNDVLASGNIAWSRFISDTAGAGVSTNGKTISIGEEVRVAGNINNSVLNIDAGSVVSCSNLTVGNSANKTGTLNMSGGDVTVSGVLSAGPNGTGILNLDGGTVNLASGGITGSSASELNLGGTSIIATADCPISVPNFTMTSPSTIDIDGHTVTVTTGIAGTAPLTINDTAGGGFFDFNLASDGTVEAPLAGSTTVGKFGAGKLTLSGSSTHTGTFSVEDGGLQITGSLNGSSLTVDGGTLYTGGAMAGSLSLSEALGETAIAYTGTPLAVTGNVSLAGTIGVDPFANGPLAPGIYPLITYTGTLTGSASNLGVPSGFVPGDFRQTFSFQAAGGSIDLVVGGSPGALVWDGPGDWDLTTTMPWDGGESFYQIDGVTFEDSATDGAVNIVGSVLPGSVLVNNDTLPYSFGGTGSINGATSLVKQGPGTLTVNNVNGYTGGTLISGGVVELDPSARLGTGVITISSGTLRGLVNAPSYINGSTNPVVLGDANSGTAETIIEFPGSTTAAQSTMSMPVTVSSAAPDSKAIIRSITTLGVAAYYGGTITLDNRDLYFESAGNQLTGINGKVTGTGDLHITRAPSGLARTRLLNSSNDFVGNIYVDGTAQLQVGTGSPSGTVTSIPSGTDLIVASGANVRFTGSSVPTVGALWGDGLISIATSGSGTTRVTIGNGDKSGTYGGNMQNETSSHLLALTKTGLGTQVLNGDCTFTGSTIISGGVLEINSATYTSAITVNGTGTLGGNGTLRSTLTATTAGTKVAPGASTGTLTVTGTANLSTGGTLEIEVDDSAMPKNDQLIALGNLNISNATLDVLVNASAGQSAYIIATYGTLTGTFATENIPAGYTVDYNYLSGNQIALVSTTSSPFEAWISTNYPNLTDGDELATADPDQDGVDNILEFALNGDPTDASNSGATYSTITDADGNTQDELVLTIAVRNGSGSPSFVSGTSNEQTATVDGVVYSVEGTLDLASFTSAVSETTVVTGPLPALPSGWEYRTFRLDASQGLSGSRGFMRVAVEGAP